MFFGQCQASYMADVFRTHVADPLEDGVSVIDAYREPGQPEFEQFAGADVVVTGIYDDAKFVVTPEVAPRARLIAFPTAVFSALWPFGHSPHPNAPEAWYQYQGWQQVYGDHYLNRLLRKGVSPDEAVDRYLALDVAKEGQLERQYELAIEMQQKRDQAAGLLDVAALIERHFRQEPLFRNFSHPLNRIFLAICDAVFHALGASPDTLRTVAAAYKEPVIAGDFKPVHPGVAKYFELAWADQHTEYAFATEGPLTFEQYCRRHVHYSWNTVLWEGIALGLAGRHADAIPKLRAGLESSPRSTSGFALLGLALGMIGRHEEAIEAARKLRELDPGDYRGPFLEGVALNAIGRFSEASAAFQHASELHPYQADVLAWLHRNYRQAGLAEAAALAARRAAAVYPRNPSFAAWANAAGALG